MMSALPSIYQIEAIGALAAVVGSGLAILGHVQKKQEKKRQADDVPASRTEDGSRRKPVARTLDRLVDTWHRHQWAVRVRRLKPPDESDGRMQLARTWLDEDEVKENRRIKNKYPHLIPRELLFKKHLWSNWSFGILLIFGEKAGTADTDEFRADAIATVVATHDGQQPHLTLTVDISHEKYGIYRNAGKGWLERKTIKRGNRELNYRFLLEQSETLQRSLVESRTSSQSWSWHWRAACEGPERCDFHLLPLRWASGGAVAIVNLHGDHHENNNAQRYVALFYRDREPCGWNVANGASEYEAELVDLDKLTTREFSEEVRVYAYEQGESVGNTIKKEYLLIDTTNSRTVAMDNKNKKNFGETQRDLRDDHDGLKVVADPIRNVYNTTGRGGAAPRSPFTVKVNGSVSTKRHSIVFTLNPLELGCEVLWLAEFSLHYPREFILDGEVHASGRFLIRRPVMLLSVNFIRQVVGDRAWAKESALDSARDSNGYFFDKKHFIKIPKGEYILFKQELQFARARLQRLASEAAWAKPTRIAFEYLTSDARKSGQLTKDEQRLVAQMVNGVKRTDREEFKMRMVWHLQYGQLFDKYRDSDTDIVEPALCMLCPTTWKALELAVAYDLL